MAGFFSGALVAFTGSMVNVRVVVPVKAPLPVMVMVAVPGFTLLA